MRVEVVAHVELDPPRRADDDPALQIEEQPLERCRADEKEAVADKHRARDRFRQLVDGVADDHRLEQRENRRADDAQRAHRQRDFVQLEVMKKTSDRGHAHSCKGSRFISCRTIRSTDPSVKPCGNACGMRKPAPESSRKSSGGLRLASTNNSLRGKSSRSSALRCSGCK